MRRSCVEECVRGNHNTCWKARREYPNVYAKATSAANEIPVSGSGAWSETKSSETQLRASVVEAGIHRCRRIKGEIGLEMERSISIPHEDRETMIGGCAEDRPMGEMAVDGSEDTEQRIRHAGEVGRWNGQTYSAPMDHCESGAKRLMELRDRKMIDANAQRGCDASRSPTPRSLARFALQQIPRRLPKTETAQDAKREVPAGADHCGKLAAQIFQIGDAVQCSEVGDHAVKALRYALNIFDREDRSINTAPP